MPVKRALLLLSGGIDSPVAGHLVKDAGFDLEAVHFSLEPFTDAAAEEKCVRLAGGLGLPRLHVVPAGPPFSALTRDAAHALYFVLSKRFMLRVADQLAERLGCPFLVTGDNLAQVSSQTLTNLATIDAAATRPVLRPLLAYDKQEIVRVAEATGSFAVSVGPEVCDVLGPKHPATASTPDAAAEEEGHVDLTRLVQEALEGVKVRATGVKAIAE
jgi:tRNA uracil 4-sulfurtransferase